MTGAAARFFAIAWIAWSLCFISLRERATWTPFAFVGLSLAAVAVGRGIVPLWQLRLSFRTAAWGVGGGVLMVVGTHLLYRAVVAFLPAVGEATAQLVTLLFVAGDFPAGVRAALIVVVAGCEEVLFRGLLPSSPAERAGPHVPTRRELGTILGFAAVYALTPLALGRPLLVVCALVCGSLWGLMRVATGSLVIPLLAHVVWDLGILLVWPLPTVP